MISDLIYDSIDVIRVINLTAVQNGITQLSIDINVIDLLSNVEHFEVVHPYELSPCPT